MAITYHFRFTRDTAANWANDNPVLAAGEPGIEADTLKVKYGNGSSPWNSLDYDTDTRAITVLDGGNARGR